jgi:hypothetical protein
VRAAPHAYVDGETLRGGRHHHEEGRSHNVPYHPAVPTQQRYLRERRGGRHAHGERGDTTVKAQPPRPGVRAGHGVSFGVRIHYVLIAGGRLTVRPSVGLSGCLAVGLFGC